MEGSTPKEPRAAVNRPVSAELLRSSFCCWAVRGSLLKYLENKFLNSFDTCCPAAAPPEVAAQAAKGFLVKRAVPALNKAAPPVSKAVSMAPPTVGNSPSYGIAATGLPVLGSVY